jgi:hypothetical protein
VNHATAATYGAGRTIHLYFREVFKMSNAAEVINPNESRYTEDEAAHKLGLKSRITLWRWRRRKLIGFYKIGNKVYYGDSHLRAFLARCERKAK